MRQRVRHHMQQHHVFYIAYQPGLPGKAAQKGFCQRDSFLLMIIGMKNAVFLLGANCLSKIMGQCGKHKPVGVLCVFSQQCSLIQYHHRVVPHIPFGMINRILGNIDQGLHLRKPDVQLLHFAENFKENRRTFRLCNRFLQFPGNPFPREKRKLHSAAQGNRLLCHREAESCGKLCSPQHPEGIFGKGSVVYMVNHSGG